MRDLTEHEQTVRRLCLEQHGSDPRDNVFFLESGEAIFISWGIGYDIWVNLTNIAGWLQEGLLTEQQVKDTQIG